MEKKILKSSIQVICLKSTTIPNNINGRRFTKGTWYILELDNYNNVYIDGELAFEDYKNNEEYSKYFTMEVLV